jgi:diguanylate cyclase (GGDEF)-like protein
VRDETTVARPCGDEFAIVQVAAAGSHDAASLAARLTDVLGAPCQLDGHQVTVGVSIGIAVAPGDGDRPDVLMRNADLARDRAKAAGGGAWRFFRQEVDSVGQHGGAIARDLPEAIANREFVLGF